MALTYSLQSHRDLGGGIDVQSAESLIPDGFCEDILNADPRPRGDIAKREGYQAYAGFLPIRIKEARYTADATENLCFILDESIDLSNTRSSPIIVYGKLSNSATGDSEDFSTTNAVQYYSEFNADPRKTLVAPSGTLLVEQDEHAETTNKLFVGVAESTSTFNNTNSRIITDSISIDQSTFDIDIDYDLDGSSDKEVFVYTANKSASVGRVYVSGNSTIAGSQVFNDVDVTLGTDLITIAAHGLETGDPISFSSDGTLPSPLTTSEVYYAIKITANTFKIASSIANADLGTPIDLTALNGGPHTLHSGIRVEIPAGTHALDNFQIIPEVYIDTGTANERIIPERVEITTTGQVNIYIVNTQATSIDIFTILSAVDAANFKTGSLASGETTVTVTISTDIGEFPFTAAYLEDSITLTLELVIPDSVTYDSSTNELQVTFTRTTSTSSANFEIYYEFGRIFSNLLCVTANDGIPTLGEDETPQLTLWGINHEDIYGINAEEFAGWATHIDSYRSTAEQRLISGLGGNLFSAQTRAEIGDTYLLPELYPDLRARVDSDTIIGPAFYATGATPARTRGYITFTDGTSNFAEVTSATYTGSGNLMNYVLSMPAKAILDSTGAATTLGAVISTTAGFEDYLTVQQMGLSQLNGTFKITAVANTSATTITLTVENPNIEADLEDLTVPELAAFTAFNEVDAGGEAGIFTDQLSFLTPSPFIAGDTIENDIFGEDIIVEVLTSTGDTVSLSGLVDLTMVSSGIRLSGQRTSYLIPLRTSTGDSDSTNLVAGDMLNWTDNTADNGLAVKRQLKIVSINPNSDTNISIAGDGAEATITMATGNTIAFAVGRKVLITRSVNYSGEFEITEIVNDTSFKVSSTSTATETTGANGPTLKGNTIEIDENLEWIDTLDNSKSLVVNERWIPIEAPEHSFDLPPTTYLTHLDASDYDAQPILRSVMVNNNLYFTNQADEVMKFDGTSIYRAGLFRWQPHLFVTTDTTASNKIVTNNPTATVASSTNNIFTVTSGHERRFVVGDLIQDSRASTPTYYMVENVDTAGEIRVERVIVDSGAGSVTRVTNFSYYFRLNAIDANNNIVASAVTGAAGDFIVRISADAAINLRLVGMPIWDIYDYDRLEVEIYRTLDNGAPPYYKIATIPMNFDEDSSYLDFTDTNSDTYLGSFGDLDIVNTGLLGQELGTAWTNPLRAKYTTSAGNRLLLANVRDYPELDIQLFEREGDTINVTALSGKKFLFRRDNTDTSTTTSIANRATYEFVSSGATTITPATDITVSVGVSFTIALAGHTLVAGNWVYLFRDAVSNSAKTEFMGLWQIQSVVASTSITINYTGAVAATSNDVNRLVTATLPADIPVWIGTDGNYGMTNGNVTSTSSQEILAMRRLANNINASMRVSNLIDPWMIANSGNEFQIGQLVIQQPKSFDETLEVVLPTFTDEFRLFVNSIERSSAEQVSTSTQLYPSRVLVSYENYPEMMDNPNAVLQQDSDSLVDINSSDGQQITGMISFFGDSAFGGASKSGIVVVFKENSIYLLDVSPDPTNPAISIRNLQKLETRGLGCTAPYSIAATRDGIIFANNSGIYRLNRDLSISYIGRRMERNWLESVNRDRLDIATGHHDPISTKYKLSIPINTDDANSEVYTYNHTREGMLDDLGSWTRYNNHPATGWANLAVDAYFGSTGGRVFKIRKTGEISDYRDDSSAISLQITYKALDFGSSGIRKSVSKITTHFRSIADSENTLLKTAIDLTDDFDNTDPFVINRFGSSDGISDLATRKVTSINTSLNKQRLLYLQLRYENSAIDEPLIIAGLDFKVAGLSDKGMIQAKETVVNG